MSQSLNSGGSQSAEAIAPAPVCHSPMPLLNNAKIIGMQIPESKDPTKRLVMSGLPYFRKKH